MHFNLTSSWISTLLLVGHFSSVDCLAISRRAGPAVQTSKGLVTGITVGESSRYTLPYARPPTGVRRWQDPEAPTSFSSYDGSALPPICAQPNITSGELIGTEDCLYLTVYAPSNVKSSSSLPVIFWIHGGSFYTGASSAVDASLLASSQNVVVVTVQYRLGLFGFLKYDTLGSSGNYGLKDVIMALNYVKSEIKAFGGDASRITLAGQSSGAELIKTLFVTPSATALFHRAILQSAPLDFKDQTPELANRISNIAVDTLGCSTAACLRSKSSAQVLNAHLNIIRQGATGQIEGLRIVEPALRPVVDGTLVTRNFHTVVAAGGDLEGSNKKIMITTTHDEAASAVESTFRTQGGTAGIPEAAFPALVYGSYGDRAGAIVGSGLYDPAQVDGDDEAVADQLTVLGTDFQWTCPSQQIAINATASGMTIYLGQFDLGISFTKDEIPYTANKVAHQDDIGVVFSNSSINQTRAQRALVTEVQTRWAAFVSRASPNPISSNYQLWLPLKSGSTLNLQQLGHTNQGASVRTQTQRKDACAIRTGVWTPTA